MLLYLDCQYHFINHAFCQPNHPFRLCRWDLVHLLSLDLSWLQLPESFYQSTPLPQLIMNPPQFVLSTSGPSNIGSQPHTSTSAPAPAAVHHDSVDGWVNKLSPYTGTVFPRQTVGTRLEKSLLRLEHGRDTHKIELLRFDGSPIEWPTSIERFYEHVHNKPFSTDTQRMTQLQMDLDGQAKNLVEGLGCDGKLRFRHWRNVLVTVAW